MHTKTIDLKSRLGSRFLSSALLAITAIAVAATGTLPFLLVGTAIAVTAVSLYTKQRTDVILNKMASPIGGLEKLLLLLGIAIGISLLMHGSPAHALFENARDKADSGIGLFIETENSTAIIDIITFAMWAILAAGGIGVIAGGATQNVTVLIGGITLFFGMALIIGVLEFADGLIFA